MGHRLMISAVLIVITKHTFLSSAVLLKIHILKNVEGNAPIHVASLNMRNVCVFAIHRDKVVMRKHVATRAAWFVFKD